jgi:uncharacterized membrane protein YraQ (UPF0718 family)
MMKEKSGKMTRGGVIFLLVVTCLYALAFLADAELALNALAFATRLLYQMLPVLLLVFALIFVSNLLVKPDWVRANVGRGSGLRGWAVAVVGGILSVGPIYAWYALLRDLKSKGMRTALIAVFLYNRGIKLPLLPLMIQYFGVAYTLVLATYMTLFSLLSGILVEKMVERRPRP